MSELQFVCGSTCEVCLLARFLVPPRDFLFLESRSVVLINVCRTKRFKVEQHNNNPTNDLSNLWNFVLPTNDNIATGFRARIVDVCLIQVAISHCCCKLTRADICQCVIKSPYMLGFLTPNHRNLIKRFSPFSR